MAENVYKAHWYLIQCKPRQELRAQEHLRNQHFACYCPMHRVEKIQRGKRVALEQPLFRGYLFIHLSKLSDNWHSIRSTRGVLRIVTFADEPLVVADEIVDRVKSRPTEVGSSSLFAEGEKITIADGPFKHLDAVFRKADGEERAIVLLSLLQRDHEISIPLQQLKPVT